MHEIDSKLQRVDDTAVVMGRVIDMVCNAKEDVEKQLKTENKKIDERIKLIYEEELSFPGLFGNIIGNGENKFKRLRDYAVNQSDVIE
jgi:hypothetical protein